MQVSGLPQGIHEHFFFSVEWREYVLHSKVLSKQGGGTLIVDEQLLLPLHMAELSDPDSRWHENTLSIQLYECPKRSEHCRAYLGGAELDMATILASNASQQAVDNARVTRQVYRATLPLHYLGQEISCQVDVTIWFDPGASSFPTFPSEKYLTFFINFLFAEIPPPERAEIVQQHSVHASQQRTSQSNDYELVNSLRSFRDLQQNRALLASLEGDWKQMIPHRFLRVCSSCMGRGLTLSSCG